MYLRRQSLFKINHKMEINCRWDGRHERRVSLQIQAPCSKDFCEARLGYCEHGTNPSQGMGQFGRTCCLIRPKKHHRLDVGSRRTMPSNTLPQTLLGHICRIRIPRSGPKVRSGQEIWLITLTAGGLIDPVGLSMPLMNLITQHEPSVP